MRPKPPRRTTTAVVRDARPDERGDLAEHAEVKKVKKVKK
jgi:hypothetical protein